MRAARRIVIHSLADARAALKAASGLGVPVALASAEGAGGYAGAMWFQALIELARAEFPMVAVTAVLDCADEAGTVLNALRHGLKRVRFSGSRATLKRLQDIAAQYGAEIETGRRFPALDLWRESDAEAACRKYLAARRKQQRAQRIRESESATAVRQQASRRLPKKRTVEARTNAIKPTRRSRH